MRVATIKHNRHGFEIDHEEKEAGVTAGRGEHDRACLAGQGGRMADLEGDLSLEELETGSTAASMSSSQKAFKKNPSKIEVHRKALGKEFLSRDDDALLAVAGDDPGGVAAPWFDRRCHGPSRSHGKKVIRA